MLRFFLVFCLLGFCNVSLALDWEFLFPRKNLEDLYQWINSSLMLEEDNEPTIEDDADFLEEEFKYFVRNVNRKHFKKFQEHLRDRGIVTNIAAKQELTKIFLEIILNPEDLTEE